MTVTGAVSPDSLGMTLTHEHLGSTFGLDPAEPPEYDRAAFEAAALPMLLEARSMGVDAIVEATAAYFGRAPALLRRLSEASGVQLLTNTGLYGAASDRYVPAYARTDTVEELAGRWIREWRDGIGTTGIRPGFMKIGVDEGPLSEIDAKLVRAGALAHRETGLMIMVHTGGNVDAARAQLGLLAEAGVSPEAWIWTHAHGVESVDPLLEAADQGAWIALDGLRTDRVDDFVERILVFRDAGLLGRVLLSHDGNAYPRNGQGTPRPFVSLMTDLLPELEAAGLSAAERDRLVRINPANAFTVRRRLA